MDSYTSLSRIPQAPLAMQIWPAIDLRDGKCVRLRQGDYQRETIFADDPAAMAREFVVQGAECLHLVDLDGAREGKLVNLPSIRAIVAAVDVPCELGGGIRDSETIAELIEVGVGRLVVGTQALKQPDWFRSVCREYPGQLVLGIDARDGRVATEGWLETSDVAASDLANQFADEPLAAIVYTDIAKDGMMEGPNFVAMEEMCAAVDVPIVASGGVSRREDVAALAELPLAGCIIGRALYEGTLSLAEALSAANEKRRFTTESRRTQRREGS